MYYMGARKENHMNLSEENEWAGFSGCKMSSSDSSTTMTISQNKIRPQDERAKFLPF